MLNGRQKFELHERHAQPAESWEAIAGVKEEHERQVLQEVQRPVAGHDED